MYLSKGLSARCRIVKMLGASTVAILASAGMAQAQDASSGDAQGDAIVVEGFREVVRSSIETKRRETTIVDAISSEDIGNLPALSLSEVLETVTGAGGHRGKGGGSEIAIRGLGPFLGQTTVNGRQATNGSGDRSVNFSQFPSELVNNIKVYKSQQADLIEGGVSGLIEIGSVRPLDYGRQRVTVQLKAGYNPLADSMTNGDAIGYRGTLSYIDQYDLGGLGELGLSIGVQHNGTTNPQDRFYNSSTWTPCDATQEIEPLGEIIDGAPTSGRYRYERCTDNAIDLYDEESRDNDFFLVGNSFALRQQGEEDARNAIFAALQWQPSPSWDVNLDLQYSARDFTEDRHDLVFADARRIGPNPVYDEFGALLAFSGTSEISSDGQYFERSEDYIGGGLNVAWSPTNNLIASIDLAYSETTREDYNRRTRLRSGSTDIYGDPAPVRDFYSGSRGEIPYFYDIRNSEVPVITIDPNLFDVNDPSLYSDDALLRYDYALDHHTIKAGRFDVDYVLNNDFFRSVEAGVRLARMDYVDNFRRSEFQNADIALDRQANEACSIPFPQTGFLADEGSAIQSWATFDTVCLYNTYYELTGDENLLGPELGSVEPEDVEVREDTLAGYIMANFDSTFAGVPVRGNVGLRGVHTDVRSTGVRSGLTVVNNEDGTVSLESTGDFDTVVFDNKTFDWLPSANVIFELDTDVLLRAAVYRAIARPDPSALGAGRRFQLNDTGETGFATVEEAIRNVTASGSPSRLPLRSWNFDTSLEWYPNRDTLLSVALYHKIFQGGTVPVVQDEAFIIDGTPVSVPVVQNRTTDEVSKLTGVELNIAHTFSWLPKPFDGFGVKIGGNYAGTNYETQDILLGDQVDIETGEVTEGIIAPAKISGFSKLTYSAQLFYEIGELELQAIWKHRSLYHQDFLGGNTQLRYSGTSDVVDLRASYDFSRNVQLRFDAVNITNEPRIDYMPVATSFRDYQSFGTTYYLGLRLRY